MRWGRNAAAAAAATIAVAVAEASGRATHDATAETMGAVCIGGRVKLDEDAAGQSARFRHQEHVHVTNADRGKMGNHVLRGRFDWNVS